MRTPVGNNADRDNGGKRTDASRRQTCTHVGGKRRRTRSAQVPNVVNAFSEQEGVITYGARGPRSRTPLPRDGAP